MVLIVIEVVDDLYWLEINRSLSSPTITAIIISVITIVISIVIIIIFISIISMLLPETGWTDRRIEMRSFI